MAVIPYFLALDCVIAAGGGVGTISYNVPPQQKLTLNKMIYTSTGVWGFYALRNGNGRQYTSASQAITFRSAFFQMGASPNIGILEFPLAIEITGGDTFYGDVLDLSGAANTIHFGFVGSLDLGG